eukprot:2919209-Rhodomonas_salina.4
MTDTAYVSSGPLVGRKGGSYLLDLTLFLASLHVQDLLPGRCDALVPPDASSSRKAHTTRLQLSTAHPRTPYTLAQYHTPPYASTVPHIPYHYTLAAYLRDVPQSRGPVCHTLCQYRVSRSPVAAYARPVARPTAPSTGHCLVRA